MLGTEPVRAKDTSPGRTALGLGRQLASPGTGRKMHAGPDSYAPFRGKRVLRAVPSAGALGYSLASFGLGRGRIVAACEENKAQLIQSSRAATKPRQECRRSRRQECRRCRLESLLHGVTKTLAASKKLSCCNTILDSTKLDPVEGFQDLARGVVHRDGAAVRATHRAIRRG